MSAETDPDELNLSRPAELLANLRRMQQQVAAGKRLLNGVPLRVQLDREPRVGGFARTALGEGEVVRVGTRTEGRWEAVVFVGFEPALRAAQALLDATRPAGG